MYHILWQNMDWSKWFIKGRYSVNKKVRFQTSMLRSYLCDYSDAHIVVKETTTVQGDNNPNKRNK